MSMMRLIRRRRETRKNGFERFLGKGTKNIGHIPTREGVEFLGGGDVMGSSDRLARRYERGRRNCSLVIVLEFCVPVRAFGFIIDTQ